MSKASKNLILVEGKDEIYVFDHLFRHYGIQKEIIDFKSKDGVDNLLDSLPVELRGSELERLGIVVDAEIVQSMTRWSELMPSSIRMSYWLRFTVYDAHDETRADFSRWKGIYETWKRRKKEG